MGAGEILEDFLVPFVSIFVAEFGDKSQISLFLLAAKTKKHSLLLLGAFLAFLVVDGFAVLVGYYALGFIPLKTIRIVSAIVFISIGIFYLLRKVPTEKASVKLASPLYSGFAVTFFSEWGDKTQVASGLFATTFNPILVLFSVISALLLLSYLSVHAGKLLHKRVDRNLVEKISGVIFIVIGMTFMLG